MTIRDPSGLNDADEPTSMNDAATTGVPLSVRTSTPVWASHTLAVVSKLQAVTIREPSGLNDADSAWMNLPEGKDRSSKSCPLRVRTTAPVFASNTLAVLESGTTIRDPSGLNDAQKTAPVWNVSTSAPVLASHTLAVFSTPI